MAKEWINIVEVGPRDGLQNETKKVSTDLKIQFINALSQSGLKTIETGSFVSAKWVPQMADSSQVLRGIHHQHAVHYPVLVPNQQGLEEALKADAKDISVFTSASETFSQKNTNCSIKQSLQRIVKISELAEMHHLRIRGYISCTLGCPYEGKVSRHKVIELCEKLIELGCYEVSLGDTIGIGTAHQVKSLLLHLKKSIAAKQLAVHFHDTYSQALTNIYVALEEGVTTIDSSVCGLGGCPYAPGAGGNVATEDVLYLLNGLNLETGIDMDKLLQAGLLICDYLKIIPRSKVAMALLAKKKRINPA